MPNLVYIFSRSLAIFLINYKNKYIYLIDLFYDIDNINIENIKSILEFISRNIRINNELESRFIGDLEIDSTKNL